MSIFDRIGWYTRPTQQDLLREEYHRRELYLEYARTLEEYAAELQRIADEIRRQA